MVPGTRDSPPPEMTLLSLLSPFFSNNHSYKNREVVSWARQLNWEGELSLLARQDNCDTRDNFFSYNTGSGLPRTTHCLPSVT